MSDCTFNLFRVILFLNICKQFVIASLVSCDFETDLCGYEANKFFVRYTGKSPSSSSGPYGDKTLSELGYYALCNGKLLKKPSDKCQMFQQITLNKEAFFSFWYIMRGTEIGTLELIIDDKYVVWTRTGRQEDDWLYARLKLPRGSYKLEFSANRSSTGRTSSDIAIDDVMIEIEPLGSVFVTPMRKQTKPLRIEDVGSNFDTANDLNGWRTEFYSHRWLQENGEASELTGSFGPQSDWTSITSTTFGLKQPTRSTGLKCYIPFSFSPSHSPSRFNYYCKKIYDLSRNRKVCRLDSFDTMFQLYGICNLGYYLMITSDKFETDTDAYRSRLYSPVFGSAEAANTRSYSNACLSFKYNIFTTNNDGFRVHVENYENPEEQELIFSTNGPYKVDRWYSTNVPIVIKYKQSRIYFEPVRGILKRFASVSIDSVYIRNECDEAIIAPEIVNLPAYFFNSTTTTQMVSITKSSTTSTTTTLAVEPDQEHNVQAESASTTASTTTKLTQSVNQPDANNTMDTAIFLKIFIPIGVALVLAVTALTGVVIHLRKKKSTTTSSSS